MNGARPSDYEQRLTLLTMTPCPWIEEVSRTVHIYISLKCNKPPFLLLSNECWISCFKNTSLWELSLVVIELTATKICQRKQIWWSHTQVLSALQIVITKKRQVLGADPERKAGVIADFDPPGRNPLTDMDPPSKSASGYGSPSQIWTPNETFLSGNLFCLQAFWRCSSQNPAQKTKKNR